MIRNRFFRSVLISSFLVVAFSASSASGVRAEAQDTPEEGENCGRECREQIMQEELETVAEEEVGGIVGTVDDLLGDISQIGNEVGGLFGAITGGTDARSGRQYEASGGLS